MHTKVIIVGTMKKLWKSSNNFGYMILSTTRPFPNDNKIFRHDLVEVKIWPSYFKSLRDYLYCGQLLLIEGRLESVAKIDQLLIKKNYIFAENIVKLTTNLKIN